MIQIARTLPFQTLRVVAALIMREMTARYGRLSGGYLWAVVEPIGTIALLTLVFSQAFRAPPIGISFALFYASGYLPFALYADLTEKTASAIAYSRQLLFYPAVTFMDALLARFALNLVTQLLVVALVLPGILMLAETRAAISAAEIVQALMMAAALAFGIGALNCFLFAIIPVWQRVWGVLTRPLFILSCILFTFDTIPAAYREILWYNPLVHVVGLMRAGIYPTYDAAYASPAYVYGLSLAFGVLGLLLLRRFKSRILNE